MTQEQTVYRDLEESIYKVEMGYDLKVKAINTTFYFCKKISMNRFLKGYIAFRKKLKQKLQSLYLVNVNIDEYADIIFYNQCERSGFYIEHNGVVVKCLTKVELDGAIRIVKN